MQGLLQGTNMQGTGQSRGYVLPSYFSLEIARSTPCSITELIAKQRTSGFPHRWLRVCAWVGMGAMGQQAVRLQMCTAPQRQYRVAACMDQWQQKVLFSDNVEQQRQNRLNAAAASTPI